MRLFRYVLAPFPLKENIVATIRHDKEYLAVHPSGMIGKEWSATEILKCNRINRVFHCNGGNVLQKNLEQLCLYNLCRSHRKPLWCGNQQGHISRHSIEWQSVQDSRYWAYAINENLSRWQYISGNHSGGVYPDVNGKLPQSEYSGPCIHQKSPCHFVTTVNSSASHPESS